MPLSPLPQKRSDDGAKTKRDEEEAQFRRDMLQASQESRQLQQQQLQQQQQQLQQQYQATREMTTVLAGFLTVFQQSKGRSGDPPPPGQQ